tara:strand:- start:229 stop:3762 length:3534 start_codon:yes stop_codon:yes gene_type:complete
MFDDYENIFDDILQESSNVEITTKLKEGERRNVTTLFGDIKGFVNISETVDSEDLKNLMDRFFKVMTQLVEKYGGYVDKYSGDQIMALFGAKVASEIDVQRALVCALEIQKQIRKLNQLLKADPKFKDIDVSIRIGVCSGIVTTGKIGKEREGDFTVYGDSVNLASRLEQIAKPGTVYTDKNTIDFVKEYFIFDDLGEFEIKGKDELQKVFEVKEIKERSSDNKHYKTPYIGREGSLKILDNAYQSCKSKTKNKIVEYIGVNADAGIGKTRFIKEFIDSIYDTKYSKKYCITGYASNISSQPYQIFISLIKDHVGISYLDDEQSVKKKIKNFFEDLSPKLEPELKKSFDNCFPIISFLLGIKVDDPRLHDKGKGLQTHIQLSLNVFIKAIAHKTNLSGLPLMIIIEDLHWVDRLSQSVIDYIAQDINIDKIDQKDLDNILFIFSYRPSFKFLDTYKGISLTEVILKPFNDTQSKELINEYLKDYKISNDTIDELLKKSDGNPFFIEQYLKLFKDDSSQIEGYEIPDNLNSLILSRIDELGDDLKFVLQKASVVGEKFYRMILQIIDEKLDSSISLNDLIQELERKDFVNQDISMDDLYHFKHILTRDVAYNTILKSNKKILHQFSAEIIEQNFSHSIENFYYDLANHYDIAEDSVNTLKYLELASKRARDLFDNHQAIKFYNRMLDLVSEDNYQKQIEIKLKVIQVYQLIGEWDKCYGMLNKILSIAIKNNMHKESVKIQSALGEILHLKGDNAKARDIFDKQLPLLKEMDYLDSFNRVKGLLASIDIDEGNLPRALNSFEEMLDYYKKVKSKLDIAIVFGKIGEINLRKGELDSAYDNFNHQFEICSELDSKDQSSRALGNIAIINSIKKQFSESRKIFKNLIDIYKDIGDMKALAQTYGNIGISHKELKEFDKALEYYDIQLKIAHQMGDKGSEAIAEGNIGIAFWKKGDFVEALKHLEKAVKINEKINLKNSILYQCNIAELSIDMGDYASAQKYLDSTQELNKKINDEYILAFIQFNRGRLLFEKEDYSDSIKILKKTSDFYLKIGHKPKYARILLLISNCYFELKDIENAKKYCNLTLDNPEISGTGIEREANIYELLYDYILSENEEILNKIDNQLTKDASNLLKSKSYYLIWKITNKKEYAKKTLGLLRDIYSAKPIYYYSQICKILESV